MSDLTDFIAVLEAADLEAKDREMEVNQARNDITQNDILLRRVFRDYNSLRVGLDKLTKKLKRLEMYAT